MMEFLAQNQTAIVSGLIAVGVICFGVAILLLERKVLKLERKFK